MRGTYLRVGLLILLGAGLLIGAVLMLSGTQIRHGRTYETYFRDSVQGLDVGAPVKYKGVAIGSVTQIALTSAEYGRGQPDEIRRQRFRDVLVRFDIDTMRVGSPPGQASIGLGLRARIAPQGLTGVSYVELDYADPARYPPIDLSWTPRYAYIPSMPSTFSQVQDAATGLLGKLQQVDFAGLANSLTQVLADVHGEMQDGDAHAVLAQATATLRSVQTALDQVDVPALAAELRRTLAAAQTLADGPQTKQLLRSAATATERLGQATAQLPALIASLQAVARQANAGSADIEAGLVPLLRDARTTVAALRETSEALRRDPSQVVFGAPPPRSRDR